MCMSVNDLILYSTRYIPVTTFIFFILLYWNWLTSVNHVSIVIHKLFTFLC